MLGTMIPPTTRRSVTNVVYSVKRQQQSQRTITSAPSGISQLRKASDQNQFEKQNTDSMNLDEFMNFDNSGTPGTATSSPELEKKDKQSSSHATASAIHIRSSLKKGSAQNIVPQSVPANQHPRQRTQDEFGYLQRHVRKTSIDERRVCFSTL